MYLCAFFTGRKLFSLCFIFRGELFVQTWGLCRESSLVNWEKWRISKSIPLPLSKLKNHRHLLLLQQDAPAAQRCVHSVMWLLATKCSLVFKYMLKCTGNLKKKLVPDSDFPGSLLPLPSASFPCHSASLFDDCALCDLWTNTPEDELCVTCALFPLCRLLGPSAFLWDFEHATRTSGDVDGGHASQRLCGPTRTSVVLQFNAAKSHEYNY